MVNNIPNSQQLTVIAERRITMQTYKLFLSLTFLLSLCIACQNTKDTKLNTIADNIERIKQVELDSETAILEDNLEKYMTLYDENAVAMWPDVPPFVGKEAIRKSYQDNIFTKLTYSEMTHFPDEIEIAGQWAFVRGKSLVVVKPKKDGTQMRISHKYINILRKQPDGSWKYWRVISNVNPIEDTEKSK